MERPEPPLAPRAALQRVRTTGSSPKVRRRARGQEQDTGRDPALVGELVESLIQAHGWQADVSAGAVLAQWDALVGAEVAQHCQPERVEDGVLHVRTDSTAWATQVRLLTPQLLSRLSQGVGEGVVTKVVVSGPAAPSWKKGRKTVAGRGPRDTYG